MHVYTPLWVGRALSIIRFIGGESVTSPAAIFVPLCNQVKPTSNMDGEHDRATDSPSRIVTDVNNLVTVKSIG